MSVPSRPRGRTFRDSKGSPLSLAYDWVSERDAVGLTRPILGPSGPTSGSSDPSFVRSCVGGLPSLSVGSTRGRGSQDHSPPDKCK